MQDSFFSYKCRSMYVLLYLKYAAVACYIIGQLYLELGIDSSSAVGQVPPFANIIGAYVQFVAENENDIK